MIPIKERKPELFNHLVCHNFKSSIGILIKQILPLSTVKKEFENREKSLHIVFLEFSEYQGSDERIKKTFNRIILYESIALG